MKKHTYEQPLAETFELSIQNTILDGSPNGGIQNIGNDNVVNDDDGYNG